MKKTTLQKLTTAAALLLVSFCFSNLKAEDAPREMLSNPNFTENMEQWNMESYGLAQAKAQVLPLGVEDSNALVVEVGDTGSGDIWKVQVSQKGLVLLGGKTYRLRFWGKSSVGKWFHVGFSSSLSPWGQIAGAEGKSFGALDAWKEYTYEFTPTKEAGNVRLLITNLNQINTTWSFCKFSLTEITPP